MMTWKPLSLITAILLVHLLVFGTFGVLGFAPTPTPRPTPHTTYTPNPALARHYVSPTVTPTQTITPGPTSVFSVGPERF
jgi:hypothetical protein